MRRLRLRRGLRFGRLLRSLSAGVLGGCLFDLVMS